MFVERSKMKNKIDDLYFGIQIIDPNSKKLEIKNLFDFCQNRKSVARYIKEVSKEKPEKYIIEKPLMFLFGDVWGRVEYEFNIREPFSEKDDGQKISVFDLFVVPNEKILLDMVKQVTLNEANRWLRKNK